MLSGKPVVDYFGRFLLETFVILQGASKNGKTPDGTPYIEAAEKDEIKELLT